MVTTHARTVIPSPGLSAIPDSIGWKPPTIRPQEPGIALARAANKRYPVERRTLCPCCGARPKWLIKVELEQESVVQNWWCPQCSTLIESSQFVADQYLDPSVDVKFTRSVRLS
jgi:rubredoxin